MDPTDSPLELDRLRAAILHLARRIRASSDDGITASQRSTLGTIQQFGPVSISHIAEREHVRPPSASKIVSGLEALGYIERVDDPADRRCSLIDLTPSGHEAVQRMRTAGVGFLAGRLAERDAADVAIIAAALPALERLLGSHRE